MRRSVQKDETIWKAFFDSFKIGLFRKKAREEKHLTRLGLAKFVNKKQ